MSQLRLRFAGVLIGGGATIIHVALSTRGPACALRQQIEFHIDHPAVTVDGNPARVHLHALVTRRGTVVLFPVENWCGASTKLSGVITVGALAKRVVTFLASACVLPHKPLALGTASAEPAP